MEQSIQSKEVKESIFVNDLRSIVSAARDVSYRMANLMQVIQNWLVGRRIVEQEQQGKHRADYGKHVIELASQVLTDEFGAGFSETQLRNFRKFYLTFSDLQIQQTMPAEFKSRLSTIQQTMPAESSAAGQVLPVQLSWSHYERLIRVTDPEARLWYMPFSIIWSVSSWRWAKAMPLSIVRCISIPKTMTIISTLCSTIIC